MLRSYLTLAFRTLRRRKAYTAVNALGLTAGLACCALVAVFLQYELTYDAHHEDADRIYRIVSTYGDGREFSSLAFPSFFSSTPEEQRALAERLPASIPAVEQATNFDILEDRSVFVKTADGDRFTSDRQLVTNTGAAFADLFTFERVAGDPLADALRQPGGVVLTASTARAYFGDADPIGGTLTIDTTAATVRTVIADPPPNSRLTFDFAHSVEAIPWWAAFHYVRLAPVANPDAVASQITAVMNEVRPGRTEQATPPTETLQPLTDLHFAERTLYDDSPNRNVAYLWVFGAIGLLVLGITTVSYTNLSLALHAGRNTEVAIRKVVGGFPRQIAGQFLAEATLLAILCVPLALLVSAAVLPAFNALMGTAIGEGHLLQPVVLLALVGLAVGAGLVAGGYPAFVLARKRTVELFGRGLTARGRGWSMRHGLIAAQFVVLIALGSLSWVAYDQLRFMQSDATGFPTEGVVRTNFSGDSLAYQDYRQRLLRSSAVEAVGLGGGAVPRRPANRTTFLITDATNPDEAAPDSADGRVLDGGNLKRVDMHWFDVMGIEHPVVAAMQATGPTAPERALINQSAADLIAASGTDEVVGKTWKFNPGGGGLAFEIAGVMPDVHINSMREAIAPTVFAVSAQPSSGYNVLVRFAPGRTAEGLRHVRTVLAEVRPDTPSEVSFLSESVADLYEEERRFGILTTTLATLAILLAALGLAGLVGYLTRLRIKEIGVRKALGGSVGGIVALLNREYVVIVGVAFAVGVPLAWLAADWWLRRFAYQVDLSPLVFVATGVGALAVAVAAVSVQAVRAARISPAEALRSE